MTEKKQHVLIVDDEKNIRLTMTQALAPLGCETDTAVNGEEALGKIAGGPFDLIVLDLRMPGMNGMEVLRRVVEAQPEIRVIIVTAYGTVESAVDAMKLGAVDFIQKPFTPQQIRDLVSKVLDRGRLAAEEAHSYDALVELARLRMNERRFDAAMEIAEKATKVAPKRPEAWNLLGIASEVLRERGKALDFYRMALQVDGTYEPARRNLERGLPGSEDRSLDLGGPAKGKDE